MVKFGVRVRTDLEHPPAPNFVKIAKADSSLRGIFYQKFEIFAIFSYLSPHLYTVMLKFGLLNHSTTQNFLRIAQGILHMACRYCSALEVMHIDFEFCSVFVFIQLKNSHSRKINGDNFRFCYMYKNSSGHWSSLTVL